MGPASPPLAPPPQGSCLSCRQLVLSYLLAVTQALGLPRAQGPLLGSSPARVQPCLGLAWLTKEWPKCL